MGKKLLFFLMLLLFMAGEGLFAQIGMDLEINRNTFLQFEPVYAKITFRNDSGKALLFGKSPRLQGFLMLEITGSGQKFVQKRKGKEISIDGLVLGPGEIRSLIIPISEYYDISQADNYKIHAYVAHSMLKQEYKSPDRFFQVEHGGVIWKRTVGIPDLYGQLRTQGNERTYEIRTIYENRRRHYYLVVSDSKNVYGVVRLGHQMGYEKLQIEVDMLSRIHVLVPVTPKVFHYLSFSLDGANINNTFWKTAATIPQLYRNPKTGVVTRIGGVEAVRGRDFVDPNRGKKPASQILMDEDLDNAARNYVPKPRKNKPMFDLGKGLEKTVRDN
ncbi:MAG: hypothetical protein J6S54_03110 [Lentisphaeria bacterium]|nr:hypothetical protein [Lentisphaeria bacterium]